MAYINYFKSENLKGNQVITRHPEVKYIARNMPLAEVAKIEPVARELCGVTNLVIQPPLAIPLQIE